MKLYYSPGACSLACRISLHEAGIAADFERVDLKSKLTDNAPFYRPALIEVSPGHWVAEHDPAEGGKGLYAPQLTGKYLPTPG